MKPIEQVMRTAPVIPVLVVEDVADAVPMAQALVAGCELVINDPSEDMKPLDWIVEVGATYVMGVPTHAMDILADQKSRGMESLGAVKMFYMAGASIPISVARAFLDQGIKPQNVYGMTENSSHHFTWPNDPPDIICATCGRANSFYGPHVKTRCA